MSNPTIEIITPEQAPDIAADQLQGGNLLVIGGPWVGKSHEFKSNANLSRVTDLDDAVYQLSNGEEVVFDEVYSAYTGTSEADGWEAVLGAEAGVAIVVRPWQLDWLLQNTEFGTHLAWETYKVLVAQYDRERRFSGPDIPAETKCEQISGFDRDAIENNLEKLQYSYTFATDELDIDEYETYLPPLLTHSRIATLDGGGGIFRSVVRDSVAKLSEDGITSPLVNVIETVGDRITDSELSLVAGELDTDRAVSMLDGLPASTVAYATGHPVAIGAGLVFIALSWYRNRDTGAPKTAQAQVEAFLGPLGTDRLLPHTEATFEAELDLPPGTIASVSEFLDDPQTLQRLEALLAFDPSRVDDAEDRIAAIETRLDNIDTGTPQAALEERISEIEAVLDDPAALDEIAAINDAVADNTATLTEFQASLQGVADQIEGFTHDAVVDLATTKREERDRRRKRLQEYDLAASTVEATIRPVYPTILHEEQISKTVDQLSQGAEDGSVPVVLVRGPTGVGKSAFCYHLADRLESEGIMSRQYNSGEEFRFARQRLRDIGADESPCALFYDHTGTIGPGSVRRIFGDELHDLIDVLVIEVSDPMYHSLERAWTEIEGIEENPAASRLKRGQQVVGTIGDADAPGVVELDTVTESAIRTIIDGFGITDPDTVGDIVAVSEEMPYIAIEACLLVSGGVDIADLSQQRLITRSLNSAVERFDAAISLPAGRLKRAVYVLALLRRVRSLDTVFNIVTIESDLDRATLRTFIREEMRGYVRQSEAGNWGLTPELYAFHLFRQYWFDTPMTPSATPPTIDRGDLLEAILETAPRGLYACCLHLETAWQGAGATGLGAIDDEPVRVAAEELLGIAEGKQIHSHCLRRLLAGGVPVDPTGMDDDQIWKEEYIALRLNIDPMTSAPRSDLPITASAGLTCMWFLATHAIADCTRDVEVDHQAAVEHMTPIVQETAQQLYDHYEADLGAFLPGIYANAVVTLAESTTDEKRSTVEPWFDRFESELRDVIAGIEADVRYDVVLLEFYAKVLTLLAGEHSPTEDPGWFDIVRVGLSLAPLDHTQQLQLYETVAASLVESAPVTDRDEWYATIKRSVRDLEAHPLTANATTEFETGLVDRVDQVPPGLTFDNKESDSTDTG